MAIAVLALAVALVATWAACEWLDHSPSIQPLDPTYDTRHPRP